MKLRKIHKLISSVYIKYGHGRVHLTSHLIYIFSWGRLPKETNESGFMTQKTDVYSFGVLIWETENALCQLDNPPRTHLVPYCHVKHNEVQRCILSSNCSLQYPIIGKEN